MSGDVILTFGNQLHSSTIHSGNRPRIDNPFWWNTIWRIGLAAMHFVTLPMALVFLSALPLTYIPLVLLMFGTFFGLINFANAKHLIRHSNRYVHQLGAMVYASLLFGHRASSEILVHQIHMATPNDPNTAKQGETVYRFMIRAWVGSYMAGLHCENKRRMAFNHGQVDLFHPYLKYWLVPLIVGFAIYWLIGGDALVYYLILSVCAQVVTLLNDYVLHYGLRRERNHFKRYLPIEPQHYWVAPNWIGFDFRRPQIVQSAPPDMHMQSPHLPFTMASMMFISLFPRWFHTLMQPRLRDWQRSKPV